MDLNSLIDIYKTDKICLSTGAGVSFTSTTKYKTPGWWKLLEIIYDTGFKEFSKKQDWVSFDIIKQNSNDAWKVVDKLINLFGSEDTFQEILVQSLIQETGGDKQKKRLPIAYLNNATTLNSSIAFCSKIDCINVHPCLKPNDKIHAVLSLNYDWYFEGGATQKYNSFPFKPMIDEESEISGNKLPVYHLHGYIPFDKLSDRRRPLTMSSNTYKELYSDKKSWTKTIIKKLLGSHSTLFIGVSFDDTLLLNYLQELAKSPDCPVHFFFAKKGDFKSAKLKELRKANIHPVWLNDYVDIPWVLKEIYLEGTKPDDLKIWHRKDKQFKKIDSEEYWKILQMNKK